MNFKRLATNQQCPKENLEHIVAIIKKTLTHWWPSSLNLTLACLEVKYAAWIFGIHRNFFGVHVCRVNLPLSRLIPNLRKPKCTFKSKSFLKLVTISWALLLWETGPSIEVLKNFRYYQEKIFYTFSNNCCVSTAGKCPFLVLGPWWAL